MSARAAAAPSMSWMSARSVTTCWRASRAGRKSITRRFCATIRLSKEISLEPGSDVLKIRYLVENIPRDRPFHFAVEFNFAGMAAGADDRYFYNDQQPRAGQLQTLQQLAGANRIGLVDEW